METKSELKKSKVLRNVKLLDTKAGDGHYIAVFITIILVVIIGTLIYDRVTGSTGIVNTALDNLGTSITTFMNHLTGI